MNKLHTNTHTGLDVARVNKVQPFNLLRLNRFKSQSKLLKFGEWNVRTLLDTENNSDRAQRRTALVARELKRYNIDIAALSETRFSDIGSLTEDLGGYTFHWSGKKKGDRRDHGVALAIKTDIYNNLPQKPAPLNERIITLRIPLRKRKYITIISAYAPTMTCSENDKDQFYQDLEALLHSCNNDKIIILGDFNARVGNDTTSWPGVIGPHGVGKVNDNGERLLNFCAQHQLVITNTIFKMPDKYKTTWMHPGSKHWHQIDFVITKQQDVRDINSTRVMRGADCATDHQMIRCKVKLEIDTTSRKKPSRLPRINLTKLKNRSYKDKYEESTNEEISKVEVDGENNPSEAWSRIKDILIRTGRNVLGKPKRENQDWFDENDSKIALLLANRDAAYQDLLQTRPTRSKTTAYKNACKELQCATRDMKRLVGREGRATAVLCRYQQYERIL